MKTVYWDGPDTNLGRFGIVRRGDLLNLMDDEAEMVARNKDKRFKAYKEGQKLPEPIETESAKTQDEAARKQAELEEKARKDALAKENSPERVELLELGTMSREDLIEKIKLLNDQGHKIVVNDRMGTILLRQIIRTAMRNVSDDADMRQEEPKEDEGDASGAGTGSADSGATGATGSGAAIALPPGGAAGTDTPGASTDDKGKADTTDGSKIKAALIESLYEMTKAQLLEKATELKITVDGSQSKAAIIGDMVKALDAK